MDNLKNEDVKKYISKKTLQARKECNLTQSELASRTGINQTQICNLEKGLANPTVKKLKKIADGLNMDLEINFKKR